MAEIELKPVYWLRSSRRDVRSFPKPVRRDLGQAIYTAQCGGVDLAAKPLRGFGGADVLEVVASHRGNTWRAVYTVRFSDCIYVLHAFQKKSTKGTATPKRELDLIRQRLAEAKMDYQQRQDKK